MVQGYQQDDHSKALLVSLSLGKSEPHFTLQNGLLRYKGRIWLGTNVLLQHKVLHALHTSPVGGHSSFPVTYRKVKCHFAWPKMKKMVKDFVAACPVCQQAKFERVKYPGLLLPLPVPQQSWQVVTMDFIEGLPTSNRYNCILVVVDKLSKYSHFIALIHPFNAQTVANAFMDHVYKLHGMPETIISDRDKNFTSHF